MRSILQSLLVLLLAAAMLVVCPGCIMHSMDEVDDHPDLPVTNPILDVEASEDVREPYTKLKGDGRDTVTVMAYIVGSDLETEDGCASADIGEMLQADLGDQVNLVLQTGGAVRWADSRISAETCQRWQISNGEMLQIGDAGDVDMSTSDALADFIADCAQQFPADRYCLVLWNHGGGAVSGFGYDERYDSDMMSLQEIDDALTMAEVKFDFVGFDACLMATIETAFMLERHADYLIASEETEPGTGWAYTDWLTALGADTSVDTVVLGKRIVDGFVSAAGPFDETTLSVVDLRYIPAAYERLCAFLSEAEERIVDGDYKTFSVARADAKAYGEGDFEQIDAQDYMMRTGLSGAQEVCAMIRQAVRYYNGSVADSYGLAMYFPYKALSWYDNMHHTLLDIGMDETYIGFFDSFVSVMAAGQVYGADGPFSTQDAENFEQYLWYDEDVVASYSETYADGEQQELLIDEKDGGFVLSLTDEQWADIVGIELQVYLDDGSGYAELGSDPLFEFDDDGDLMIQYDGYWVAINGQIVPFFTESYDEYTDGRWTNYGYAPCRVNGIDRELVLYWGDDCPSGTVVGYRNVTNIGGPAAKGVYSLTDGDVLSFYANRYHYDGDYIQSAALGPEMIVHGDLTVSYEYVGDGACIVYYMLTDIYGNCSWTEPVIAA
jgi:hypothetical protein